MVAWLPPIDAVSDELANLAVRSYGVGFGIYGQLSHLAFVPVLVRAGMFRNGIGVVLTLILMATSMFYHACQSFNVCGGFSEPETRKFDHTTAPLAILIAGWLFVNALGMRTTPEHYAHFMGAVLPVQVLVVAMAVQLHPYDSLPAIVAVVAVIFGIYAYVIFFRIEPYRRRGDPDLRRWPLRMHWPTVVASLMAGGLAIAMFIIDDPSTLMHSHWHVFVAVALLLLQEAVYNRTLTPAHE